MGPGHGSDGLRVPSAADVVKRRPAPSRLSQAIDVTDPDHFTSNAVSEFFDVGGNKYREGCATAVGQRFE